MVWLSIGVMVSNVGILDVWMLMNKSMEYDEMMFLANMRRQAKVEFENNLWKRRFEELNGFPMEEGLGKENIIMPFSENDYLENKEISE